MVSQARETFGGLHIVFNAAGILRDKMFHNMFPEDWQAVINVHLTGHFNINRAAVTLFREANYGRMIMVSSTSGLLGNIGQCNYGAAKLGIVALARIVAMENASKGITVNVICPSADTRMTRSVPAPKDPQSRRPGCGVAAPRAGPPLAGPLSPSFWARDLPQCRRAAIPIAGSSERLVARMEITRDNPHGREV